MVSPFFVDVDFHLEEQASESVSVVLEEPRSCVSAIARVTDVDDPCALRSTRNFVSCIGNAPKRERGSDSLAKVIGMDPHSGLRANVRIGVLVHGRSAELPRFRGANLQGGGPLPCHQGGDNGFGGCRCCTEVPLLYSDKFREFASGVRRTHDGDISVDRRECDIHVTMLPDGASASSDAHDPTPDV